MRRTLVASAGGSVAFRLPSVDWEVDPEPADGAEREALVQAAAEALDREPDSEWWRSGLEDLGRGAAAKHPWRGPRVVEP